MKKVEYVEVKWERYNGQKLEEGMLVQIQGGFKIFNCIYNAKKQEFQFAKEFAFMGLRWYSKRAFKAKGVIEESGDTKLLNVEVGRCCQN